MKVEYYIDKSEVSMRSIPVMPLLLSDISALNTIVTVAFVTIRFYLFSFV